MPVQHVPFEEVVKHVPKRAKSTYPGAVFFNFCQLTFKEALFCRMGSIDLMCVFEDATSVRQNKVYS